MLFFFSVYLNAHLGYYFIAFDRGIFHIFMNLIQNGREFGRESAVNASSGTEYAELVNQPVSR